MKQRKKRRDNKIRLADAERIIKAVALLLLALGALIASLYGTGPA
jgi:hypothetical protein